MKVSEMVAEFHRKHGAPVERTPVTPAQMRQRAVLRMDLIAEEADELRTGLGLIANYDEHDPSAFPLFRADADPVAVADALGDLVYVIYGAALEWGIPLDDVIAEIHRSNMTKDVGEKRGDGKIRKGATYEPPDLVAVLDRARRGGQP